MIDADRSAKAVAAVPRAVTSGEGLAASGSETPRGECRKLRATIQELRRKTTIMAAELFEMDEIRACGEEASLQLEEARSKILASNNRRKEMARVIADRNAKIESLNRANELRNSEIENISAGIRSCEERLQAYRASSEAQMQDAKSRLKTSHARRKEMALLIAKRDATISNLQGQLESAHDQITTLERDVRSSVTWWLKKIVR